MNFSTKLLNTIETEVGKKTFFIFVLFLTVLGIISAIEPSYTIIVLGSFATLMLITLNPKEAFLIAGIFLIFQVAVARNIVVLGGPEEIRNLIMRVDEVIWVFFIGYLLLHNYKGNSWQFNKTNLEPIAIVFAFIGLLSTFFNHNSILWASASIFLALKGFFIYWISRNLKLDEYKIKLFFITIIYILAITSIIGVLQYFGIQIFTLPLNERLGVSSASSIFAHHGTFGSLMAAGMALSIGLKFGTKKNKWVYVSFILALGLIASTVRRSIIGIILGTLFVMLFYRKFRIPKKYVYFFLVIIILIPVIFFGRFSNIIEGTQEEYGTNVHPRYFLYYGAYEIAKEKPLLGEGPGTFGSYVSIITNSKIYQKYKITVLDKHKADTFWPMILGEYGILGTIAFSLLLLIIFRSLLISFPKNDDNPFLKGLYIGYTILFVDYLVECLASPVYSQSLYAFFFFGGIGLLENFKEQITKEKS